MSLDAVRQLEERIAIERETGVKAPGTTPAGMPAPIALSPLLTAGYAVSFMPAPSSGITALISRGDHAWRGVGPTWQEALARAITMMRGGVMNEFNEQTETERAKAIGRVVAAFVQELSVPRLKIEAAGDLAVEYLRHLIEIENKRLIPDA